MPICLVAVLLAALALIVPPAGAFAQATATSQSRQRAASVFDPILRDLRPARIPVYLPSWLPLFKKRVYAFGGMNDTRGQSYFVFLSTRRHGGGDANLVFTFDARSGPADRTGRAVKLPTGAVAHIDPHTGGNRGPTISWGIGPYSYEIGYLYPESRLIRAARSMVRVHFGHKRGTP